MMIATNKDTLSDLEEVRYYLSESELFNCNSEIGNAQRSDMIKNHSLLILAYDRDLNGWSNIFQAARSNKIPVIIYTNQHHLSQPEREALNEAIGGSYSFLTFANNKVSITNAIFTTLSTHNIKNNG